MYSHWSGLESTQQSQKVKTFDWIKNKGIHSANPPDTVSVLASAQSTTSSASSLFVHLSATSYHSLVIASIHLSTTFYPSLLFASIHRLRNCLLLSGNFFFKYEKRLTLHYHPITLDRTYLQVKADFYWGILRKVKGKKLFIKLVFISHYQQSTRPESWRCYLSFSPPIRRALAS